MDKVEDSTENKKVRRVKIFQIRKGSDEYAMLSGLCDITTKIYNNALFVLRQLHFASYPDKHDAQYYLDRIPDIFKKYVVANKKVVKSKNEEDREITVYSLRFTSETGVDYSYDRAMWRILESNEDRGVFGRCQLHTARNAVRKAHLEYKSYLALVKRYRDGYLEDEPHLPRYKKEGRRSSFIADSFRRTKTGGIIINNMVLLKTVFVRDIEGDIKQVRIIPVEAQNIYKVEVVYENTIDGNIVVGDKSLAIDIGIDNLCAITTDGGDAVLINGKPLKNINKFYNELVADICSTYSFQQIKSGRKRRMYNLKRNNKIDTYMHQVSRWIVEYAKSNGCGTIYIGHNNGWKHGVNLGRKNNQKFVQIPFNRLIERIRYKAEEYGIRTELVNEAYTSKCSAIDSEQICKHSSYCGRRGGRHNKEFVTGKGKLLNADVNGSLNILRLGTKKDVSSIGDIMFSPPKVKGIGMKGYEMKPQNHSAKLNGMFSDGQVIGSPIKVEATVDSHCDELSPYKKASAF